MQLSIVTILALAGLAVAKGQSGNSTSTKSQCKQIQKITKLMDVASNTTKLDKVTDGNATKAAEIQAKASSAATELSTLQSNTTLVAACDQIFAVQDMEQACGEMAFIQKAQQVIANQTLLDEVTKNNATKAAEFQAKVASKATALGSMESNTTLTTFCAALSDKEACKSVAKLAKEQELAANTTALNEKLDNNADKISKFQAKVAEKATKIQSLMSNTTLMSTCESMGITVAAAASSGDTSSSSTSSDAKSAANSFKYGGPAFALVAAFASALAVL